MSQSLSAPDDRLAATLSILERLVAFDTVSSKTNLTLVADIEIYLRSLGVAYVKIPNATGDKATLFATIGPQTDGGIVLSGHTDVVPVEGQIWVSNPFSLRRANGRLYGRGTCDMKGFDALCLAMIPEFQKADLRRPLHIILSYDEEIGCGGSLDTIARFGVDLPRPGAVIVGEPTSMQVADAHKAIATYETIVYGREAHSSKPALGANAIEIACALVNELYRFQKELEAEGDPSSRFDPPYSTVHVGTIHGGVARNILAKRCAFQWEFRALPGTALTAAFDVLQDYCDRVALPKLTAHVKDARIETEADLAVPGLAADPGSQAETLALKASRHNRTTTVSFATEAGQFQTAGVPAIVCGPGSIDQAHQPDEYIEIAQLEAGIAFMRRLIAELT